MRAIRLLGAVAVLLQALPVHAQDSPLEPPDLSRFIRWGPVRVRPGVAVTNFGYDDNVFYRTGSQPTAGDFAITLSPRVEGVSLLGKAAFLTFSTRLDYTAYKKYSEINYTNTYLSGRLTIPVKRFGVYLEGARDRTQDRPTDLLDARPVRRNTRAGVGAIFELGWRTDAEIGVLRSNWRNRDANFLTTIDGDPFTIADLLDRDERGVQTKVRYRAFGRTRITLQTLRKSIDFRNDDPRIGRDATETRIVPGLDFGEGGRLAGTVRWGRASIDLARPDLTDYSGSVGEAKLSWRLGSDTTIRLGGERDARYSIWESNRIYTLTRYELRAVKYFNRLLGAEAGMSTGRLTFPGSSPARRDDLNDYDVGMRVRLSETALGRRVEYSLKWIHYRRVSTLPQFDQSRSVVGLNAVIGY